MGAARIIDQLQKLRDVTHSPDDDGTFLVWDAVLGKFKQPTSLIHETDGSLTVNYTGTGDVAINVNGGMFHMSGGKACFETDGSLIVVGLGHHGDADTELVKVRWNATDSVYQVATEHTGTGVTRPLRLLSKTLQVQSTDDTNPIQAWRNAAGTQVASVTPAGAFVGSLTGNVTGNVVGNVTGNADTATTAILAANAALLGGQAGSFYRDAGNLNAGTVPTARLGSGAADVTTFLRGDQTWATVDLASLVALAPASSARNVVVPTAAGVIPLSVKGAASQSANLTEWRNSSEAVLAYISKDGGLGVNAPSGFAGNLLACQVDGVEVLRADASSVWVGRDLYDGVVNIDCYSGSNGGPALNFCHGHTVHYELGRPDGNGDFHIKYVPSGLTYARWFYSTGVVWLTGTHTVRPFTSADVPLTVAGLASQSASLTEWQNSSGSPVAAVLSNGALSLNGLTTSALGPGRIGAYGVDPGPTNAISLGSGWGGVFFADANPSYALTVQGNLRVNSQFTTASAAIITGVPNQTGPLLTLTTQATNDDPTVSTYQDRATTTDAAVTTLHALTLADDTAYLVNANVLARRTGGAAGAAGDSATYVRQARVKRTAGGGAVIGAVNALWTDEDQAGWDCTLDASANDVRVRVTGAVNNNVTWHLVKFEVSPLGT